MNYTKYRNKVIIFFSIFVDKVNSQSQTNVEPDVDLKSPKSISFSTDAKLAITQANEKCPQKNSTLMPSKKNSTLMSKIKSKISSFSSGSVHQEAESHVEKVKLIFSF